MCSKLIKKLSPDDLVTFINEEINAMESELDQINNSEDLDCVLKANGVQQAKKQTREALKNALLTKAIVKQQTPKEFSDLVVTEIKRKIYSTTNKMDKFVNCVRQQTKRLNTVQAMGIQSRMDALQKSFSSSLHMLQKRELAAKKNAKQLQQTALEKLDDYIDLLSKKAKAPDAKDVLRIDASYVIQNFLRSQLVNVEKNIHVICKIKCEAVDYLEKVKDLMYKSTDPWKRSQKKSNTKINNLSLAKVEEIIQQIERSLSRIQHEHENGLIELEKQRGHIKKTLSCIEQLDLLANVLTYKMYESENHFRKDMEQLQAERQQLLSRQDVNEDQMALALAELDKRIADHQQNHDATMTSLQNQKEELQMESIVKVKHMDLTYQSMKEHEDVMITELEGLLEDATPSEAEICTEKLHELHELFDADAPELARLQSLGWHDLNAEEKLAAILEERGVKISKSGRMITNSGHSFTFEEAEKAGFFKGITDSFGDLLESVRKLNLKTDDFSIMSEESSEASVFSKMSSEDVHYLKEILGKPLILAMAEIVAKQPRDPIHYLGHWLFKYRYNQEIDMLEKEKIEELTAERDRIAKEKWHKMLQEEAKNVVLDMITRAEEEGLRNEMERELARILAEQEAEEEENEEM